MDDLILLSVFIFAAGLLYSSVGHAGASGYLAAMALFEVAPSDMKPVALTLNVLVATIASVQFYRSGFFSWRVFSPFALGSIPFAFIGGAVQLPGQAYKQVAGLVLLFASYRLFRSGNPASGNSVEPVPALLAILFGAGIGLLSGAIGVGGGIFLSPLLLFMGWSGTKQTAGVSAAFILVNSLAGLAGHAVSIRYLPSDYYFLAFAAACGGITGSYLGTRRFESETLYRLLAVVLVIAGLKLTLM
ncbi:MAG TPA: sulfite exporter TauE/SafE family protein [Candidatus Methanoperedenaceae archaeon]|nr:sulfite exporter TauE/SafE family protein [Candidatus Methanoperedenaceae archaeon]